MNIFLSQRWWHCPLYSLFKMPLSHIGGGHRGGGTRRTNRHYTEGKVKICPRLWIHIHFFRIRIQQFFSMRIKIQLPFKCGSRFSFNKFVKKKLLKRFLKLKKHKRLVKSKIHWSLFKFTWKNLNKLAIISNFLAFFLFLFENLLYWIRSKTLDLP